MRILSLAICSAAIACVAAHVPPGQQQQQQQAEFDVVGTQDNYAWAATATPEELALKADELAELATEISFRAELLDSLNRDFQAEDLECFAIKLGVGAALDGIIQASKATTTIPFAETAFQFFVQQLERLKGLVGNVTTDSSGIVAGLDSALSSLETILSTIKDVPLPFDISPLVKAIETTKPIIRTAVQCVLGGSKLAITQGHCAPTADMYRLFIEDATSNAPVVPDTASKEWERVAAGASSVLQLSKNAIAQSNEALLNTRPIFAADLLNQYRDEYLRVAETDEAKIYAQTYLGSIVGASNALEACLRVAADPAVAAQELQQELNAQARFEDENDKDDEDEENEETEED
ncbi:hypothetical protein BG015_002940 [Linnemannia schmuckeri]|uniref:Uncharacterized protein n=1 Tax=Linnemannia schmuckeri TaxID=64567 RepID=A0A9P5V653_9FUNG|nr:hypothetical protein BG015_002940 [Linnemannia schmuckeri]